MYRDIPAANETKNGIIVNQILNSRPEGNLFFEFDEEDTTDHRGFYSVSCDRIIILDQGVYTAVAFNFQNETNNIRLNVFEKSNICQINTLITRKLLQPINIIIEFDEIYYLARSIDFPLYASGNDPFEAIENLKIEIESLYSDLQEDDNFSVEWLNYKEIFRKIIL